MKKKFDVRQRFYFYWGIIGLCFFGVGIYFNYVTSFKFEKLFLSERAVLFFIYLVGALLIWLGGLWQGYRSHWLLDPTILLKKIPKSIRYLAAFFLLLTPTLLSLYITVNQGLLPYLVRFALLFSCVILATVFIFPTESFKRYLQHFLMLGLLAGAIYSGNRYFNQVSSYPFSLGWSEGNRIWDYSILFGSYRYINGASSDIYAFIDKGRAFVWGFPFIFPDLSIFWFRIYDALVKIIPFIILGISIIWVKKEGLGLWGKIIFGLWTFMFLLQGPIHPPLIFVAIFTYVAVRQKNLALSFIMVMLAGYGAVISRFSWAYAPGLWAGMLSLIQIDNPKFKISEWKKLFRPISLGIAGFIGGQYFPSIINIIKTKGVQGLGSIPFINSQVGTNSFNQTFLWDRLWPNPTYDPGIVLGIILTTGPLVILLILMIKNKHWKLNRMQVLGILFPSLAFLGVGLVASVKIGGGGDLHNLDMFLITMVFLAAFIWPKLWKKLFGEEGLSQPGGLLLFSILVFLMPIFWTLRSGNPLSGMISNERAETVLSAIQEHVDEAQSKGGKVLFMDQRQLLTFEIIEGVVLYDEYEKKVLIDNAFSKDEEYFQQFYDDLESHKYNLIVTEKLYFQMKNDDIFSSENNAWVQWVAIPMSEYYCIIILVDNMDFQLMIPGNDCDEATHY